MARVAAIGISGLIVIIFLFYIMGLCTPVGAFLFFLVIICPTVFLFGRALFRALTRADLEARRKAEKAASDSAEGQAQQQRRSQLDALQAALPKTPPQRMRATIRVNEFLSFATVPKSRGSSEFHRTGIPRYTVDMILELPEEDRENIKREQLDSVVIEKRPKYATDEILTILGEHDQTSRDLLERGGLSNHVAREALKNVRGDFEKYERETLDTTLGDLLRVPYTRVFDTRHEASGYADRLKETILPKVKGLLSKAQTHGDASETVEF